MTHKSPFFAAIAAAVLSASLSSVPATAQSAPAMSMNDSRGAGSNGFGKTDNSDEGKITNDVYTHGFYCDTSIKAKSATGCEVGTKFAKPPSNQFDPIYITVPLGFKVPPMSMECPDGLICIDHPPTVDLTAIGGPGNAALPGHDHFTTTLFGGRPEWWDVFVIGVKNKATYEAIHQHHSFAYIENLIDKKDPNVTMPIPTNVFLFFAVTNPS